MLREILKCPHCSSMLDEPKLLPCGASMCLKCLQALNFQIEKCPICKNKHKINPSALLEHPDTIKLLEIYKIKYDTLSRSLANSSHQLYENCKVQSRSSGGGGCLIGGGGSLDRRRPRSQPPAKLEEIISNNSGLPRTEMHNRLNEYMKKLVERVNIIENGYEQTKVLIDEEIDAIKTEIHTKADMLIDQIIEKRDTMIRDVEMYKDELLVDHFERFVQNEKFKVFQDDVVSEFKQIRSDVERLDFQKKDSEAFRNLLQRIEKLNATINDNQRLLPETDLKVGLAFKANKWPDINVPMLGDITYDSIYKIDIKSKIESFNNDYQHFKFEFGSLIDENPVSKNIGIISKNKFLVLYEKILGKVSLT